MTIAGLFQPGSEDLDTDFAGVFHLAAAPSALRKPLPPPYRHRSLRIQQVFPRELAYTPEEGVRCWIDGRIFNMEAMKQQHGAVDAATPAGLLARAQERGDLDKVLAKADGEFFAVLYDARIRKLIVCTDRMGLRPVYYRSRVQAGIPDFFFCSRLRGFLGLSGFSPQISSAAVECFLDLGHLVGDLTWFEGVELLSPATVLEIDLDTGAAPRKRRYWTWSTLSPLRLTLPEAAEELERLLKQATARRILPGEKVSVLLSGGLDSRALLGCISPQICAGTATFGQPGCRDIVYAQKLARIAGVPHITLPMTQQNWDLNRFYALWKCDGMSSPADLSSSQFSRQMRVQGPVNMNGFAGDLVAGGSYLEAGRLNTIPNADYAIHRYGRQARWTSPEDEFTHTPHTDPFVLTNRVRRFTLAGTMEADDLIEQRKPFMDAELLDFLYALPDEYRWRGNVYHRALLRMRPDLFASVPWQKTGLRLSEETGLIGRLKTKRIRVWERLGWNRLPAEFQNIPRWLAAAPAKYANLLEDKNALWPQFVEEPYRQNFNWKAGMNLRSYQRLMQAVGLEVWLQQVFNGNYREPEIPEIEEENT